MDPLRPGRLTVPHREVHYSEALSRPNSVLEADQLQMCEGLKSPTEYAELLLSLQAGSGPKHPQSGEASLSLRKS